MHLNFDEMLLKIYEKLLERKIKRVPRHIVIVSGKVGEGFLRLAKWCRKFGIKEITICTHNSLDIESLKGFRVKVINNGEAEEIEGSNPVINVLNYSGRDEIINVTRKIAEKVKSGEISIEQVDESLFERFLAIRSSPDIIIKAGNDIPDFLIWQSIYSELFFADIDWENLRYVDFLRILREYQRRERRYGR